MKTTIYSALAALAFASLLSSCAFLQKGEFAQRKYYDFPRSKHSVNETATIKTTKQTQPENNPVIDQRETEETTPLVSASVNKKEIITTRTESKKQAPAKHAVVNSATTSEETEAPAISFKKSDIKKQARELKKNFKRGEAGVMLFIMVLAAIFIPPLGIYIKDHHTNKWFWITLLLCLVGGGGYLFYVGLMGLFWLVAVIIALMDVFDLL